MTQLAQLAISDGTTTINLLNTDTGFHLSSWRPSIAGLKNNGIYQDSSIAPSKQLVFGVFDTTDEVFNLKVNAYSQDQLIYETQELLRLLQKARDYWLTEWQNEPVYLIARASCETNTRYAIIHNYSLGELDNPYAQPFFSATNIAAMDRISLGIERGHWLSNIPGESECVEIDSLVEYYNQTDWTNIGATASNIGRLLLLANGDILATTGNQTIERSQDDGVNWAVLYTFPGAFSSSPSGAPIVQAPNGYLYTFGTDAVGDTHLYQSVNNGVAWNIIDFHYDSGLAVGDIKGTVHIANNGNIIHFRSDGVRLSTDNGASFATVFTDVYVYSLGVSQATTTNTGRVIITDVHYILVSDDDGLNWEIRSNAPYSGANLFSIFSTSAGTIIMGGTYSGDNVCFVSTNDGDVFIQPSDISALNSPYYMVEDSKGIIWNAGGSKMTKSFDYGFTWVLDDDSLAGYVAAIIFDDNTIIIGDSTTDVYSKSVYVDLVLGSDETCDDEVFITNYHKTSNITHVKRYDQSGPTYTDLFPAASFPFKLFPDTLNSGDYLYIGSSSELDDYGSFNNLVFNIDQRTIITNASWIATFEYWNGAWTDYDVTDNTAIITSLPEDESEFATIKDINTIHWIQPDDWATTTVDGIVAYWIRIGISSPSSSDVDNVGPTQKEDDIYSIVNPYVNIDMENISGDIPALVKINVKNISDRYEVSTGDDPELWTNRVVIGLRSRVENFTAYLNMAQNQPGISVSTGTNTTISTDTSSPSNNSAVYNPAGVEAMATRVAITLSGDVTPDFYGTYHAFLRVYRDAGTSTAFDVRLQISSGSGGITDTTDSKQVQGTTAFEVLDFGQIKIPAGGHLTELDVNNEATINIQASATGGTPNLTIYDLILIPTDEWSIDSVDKANTAASIIGKYDLSERALEVDSLNSLKSVISSIVKVADSGFVTAIYNSITPGEAILQANATQRLWFFAMQTSATGDSYNWLAPPEIAHSVQLYKNERYLGLRGAR